MHIVYICQYFPPEMGAPAARAYEFSRRWVRAGHRVSVVCGIPNHPTGVVHPGYERHLLHHEVIEGIDVHRTWVYVTPNAGMLRRSINYISFGVSAVLASGTLRDADVCIATSPQFFSGLAGAAFTRLARLPFILEIRDLWPDSIEAVDVRTGGGVIRMLRAVERLMYRSAQRIVIVSPAFRAHIESCGIDGRRISVVTNGVDTTLFHRGAGTRTHMPDALRDRFIVLYAGTHGLAHALDTVVDAARLLESDPSVHFVLVGEGADKRRIRALASGAPNITMLDRVPRETVAVLLAEADACLVPLRSTPLFRTVIPSKMFEIMGVGRPIILGVEGQARAILEEADAGIAVEPQNAEALADAVRTLRVDPGLCARYGENGYRHVREMYNLDALAAEYLDVITSVSTHT